MLVYVAMGRISLVEKQDMTVMARTQIDETDAIHAVIRTETEAFLGADYDTWSTCWLHDERAIDIYSSPDMGLIIHKGWDAVHANVQNAFSIGDNCRKTKIRRENVAITHQDRMAWVTFDEFSANENGDLDESFETRILERDDGGWKIVLASLVVRRGYSQNSKQLAVAHDGQVVWMANGMAEALSGSSPEHSGFTISAGRLRAARPDWDKVLQEAIGRAAELHSYFSQHRFMKETGSGFRYPIILGEDKFGSVVWCALSVRDGVTYIDLDQDQALERRLMAAKVIFGLSDGQLALSKHIASGHSLKATAVELGITINTARTHLTRIYEKTGVNSQTALVRLLLSVG